MANLNPGDLNAIKDLIEVTLDEKLDRKFKEKFDKQLGFLPTKDEFFAETAKIYKKMEDIVKYPFCCTNFLNG